MSSIRISEALARRFNLPPVVIHDILVAAFDEVEGQAGTTGRCEVRPLGVFKLKRVASRSRRNPRTGEPVLVPETVRLVFAHSSARAKALADITLAKPARSAQDSTTTP